MADIDYLGDATARTSTTLESTDMTFLGSDVSENPLITDYSDIKAGIFAAIVTQDTIAADDVTPAVGTGKISVLTTSANTGATAITDFDGAAAGQFLVIIGGSATNSSTIGDSGNFTLSAAWTAAADAVLVLFVVADNDYIEISRSANG